MAILRKKDRALGVARGKRRYDVPLDKGTGGRFLILIIALMSFLAILAITATFFLSGMSKHWISGLENQVTVEIPAKDTDDTILSRTEVNERADKAHAFLMNHPAIAEANLMDEEEIAALVEPWLGDDLLAAGNVPLPAMITVTIKDDQNNAATIARLEERLRSAVPTARVDTHEKWLRDLLRFTGALQFAAVSLALVIGLTTVTAVAGAVRSRMAEYEEEVELLHLMGAHDNYISGQFQRYCLVKGFIGGLCGLALGWLVIFIVGWLGGNMDLGLMPDLSMSWIQISMICAMPVILALLAKFTARITVMNVLGRMP